MYKEELRKKQIQRVLKKIEHTESLIYRNPSINEADKRKRRML